MLYEYDFRNSSMAELDINMVCKSGKCSKCSRTKIGTQYAAIMHIFDQNCLEIKTILHGFCILTSIVNRLDIHTINIR